MPESITLRAGSDEALCNGVQTLCQYIEQHGAVLPALEIEELGPILLTEAIIRTAPADVSRRWII